MEMVFIPDMKCVCSEYCCVLYLLSSQSVLNGSESQLKLFHYGFTAVDPFIMFPGIYMR